MPVLVPAPNHSGGRSCRLRSADYRLLDALDAESIAQRLFDSDRNDYAYTLLPRTRTFVYSDVARQQDLENRIRRRLSEWFEAKYIRDPTSEK